MKFDVILAVVFTALILFACTRPSDKNRLTVPLQGFYRLDSIAVSRDTTLGDVLALMALHNDINGICVRFTTDSVFTYQKSDTSTMSYRFNASTGWLTLQEANSLDSFSYSALSSRNLVLRSSGHEFYLERL